MKNNYLNNPIENFVPHRKPMLLLDKLLYVDEKNTEASYTIDANCIFLKENNEIETIALLEILAQSFAAGNGVTNPQSFGYLASMRSMKVFGTAKLGDTLVAKVKCLATVGDIMVIEGQLFKQGECIVSGQFKIFAPLSQG